jgi:hypothetical protein
MNNKLRRVARSIFAPKAIVTGAATFEFGWGLATYLRSSGHLSYGTDLHGNLFLAFALLVASVSLSTGKAWGNLLAAVLCPLPILQALIFWEDVHRAGASLFSGAHLRFWINDLASMPPGLWRLTALSFVVLSLATTATLRQPAKLRTGSQT